ncbi:sensor histidine kinase [Cytophaga aurantiaca]|uniref:sensor histidine kinase n=1 Tax=Cytophaga aurantiaca TaxID=29530 RepID=UPI00037FD013|nr:ATP-binding protein [Cytophaga aurantiaca]
MANEEFLNDRIRPILKLLEDGTDAHDLCRKYDISLDTLYKWKARYGGTENLLSRLQELEEENYTLKSMLSDVRIQRDANNTGDIDRIYRILAANIPGTAITILDREERYLLAEGDFLTTMGYTKETMPGKKISEIITPENYDGYYKDVIQQAFAGETILTERQTISGYFSLMKVVPLRDGRGDIFAIMFVLIDVTGIKMAQNQLRKINEKLEFIVQERTKQLKEANRQLEAFSYSVSHDLKAPLRRVAGFSRMLQQNHIAALDDNEAKRLADRIESNVSSMEKLIDDLLAFSKFQRQELSKSSIIMEKMVRGILHELTSQETSRTFELVVSPLEPAYGDVSLIRQVWINLLSNAVKYSRKKDITKITVSCKKEEKRITYSVTDNGAGFDMAYSDKIFGVFQRLHSASEFEGTGVGLALAKNIIERHGGTIGFESEVDKGTTFYFTLPVKG